MKPGWCWVRFGDVVRQCKEKADPETSGLERYIAGDHMDTDDLRLRRWGEIGSGYLGPAFHMRFKPGQILYGSRRTYLRKVAVADFDGICANTTFVLESKDPNELLPEYLPFLMKTDAFNEFSVKNSKGSVNPYINFSDLAKFEFALPPKQEQIKLVELLSSSYSVFNAATSAIDAAWDALRSLLVETFSTGADPLRNAVHTKWNCEPLNRFITVKHGWAFKGDYFSEDASNGSQLLIPGNFTEFGRFDFSPAKNKYYTGDFPDDYRLVRGDLLLLMTDLTPSAKLLGAPGIVEGQTALLHNQRLGKIVLNHLIGNNADAFKDYLHFFFMSEVFRRQVRAQSAGSTVSHTSPTQICRIAIPCPEESEIESILAPLRGARDALMALKQRAASASELMSFLRQEVLERHP
jgi:restriction endonuclease S subunit